MPCKLTKSLQESVIQSPRLLNSEEWQPHLKTCDHCFQEAKILDKSLELYLQLETAETTRLPEIQVWNEVEQKIGTPPRLIYFPQRTKGLAAAAAIIFLVGISLWWQSTTSIDPQILASATSLPANYQVEDIQMHQPFGSPAAQTRLVWTKQHFGISIKNTAQGNYPTISIGMNLSEELAQMPSIQTIPLSELAYFLPNEKHHSSY